MHQTEYKFMVHGNTIIQRKVFQKFEGAFPDYFIQQHTADLYNLYQNLPSNTVSAPKKANSQQEVILMISDLSFIAELRH